MHTGFIYRFKNANGRHPFIFIKHKDWEYFIGCMITSALNSERHPENILMDVSHFEAFNEQGREYSIQFKKSNLVRVFLTKRTSEVNKKPCGKLTDAGLKFLEQEIVDKMPRYWHDEENWPKF